MEKTDRQRVLLYDHNHALVGRLIEQFAELVRESGVKVIVLSHKQPSRVRGNLEVVNIHDVPQKRTLVELQERYDSSLHKALVPERAFYDYTSFRRSQCYSRLSEEQIAQKITPYVNALDYTIRERVDVIIEWFPDNFVSSVASMIAAEYKKPCLIPFPHYWWKDGALTLDRMNMTSTIIDGHYRQFYEHPELLDLDHLQRTYKKPVTTAFSFKRSKMYTFMDAIRLRINRQRSYQPVSLRNWIVRRTSAFFSSMLIEAFIDQQHVPRDEPFVIYPLHVAPEAAILGTAPELADQFGLIKNISMNLPYGVKLYVKRHPYEHMGLGLDFAFFRRLTTLPNVRVFAKDANLNAMLDHRCFLAVGLLAGTTAIDAVLKGKPVFMFGRSYYSIADCFIKPDSFEDFSRQVTSIMRGRFQLNERALNALLGALDKSVVRADVDLLAHQNQTEQASEYPIIWHKCLEEYNRRTGVTLQNAA